MTIVYINNKKKDISILGKGPTQRLDDLTFTAEAEYSINFTGLVMTFCVSLHCNRTNSFLFAVFNVVKIYQFKAKDLKIKLYPLCLVSFSEDFKYSLKKYNIEYY